MLSHLQNSRLEPQHVIARNAGDFCRILRQSQLAVRGTIPKRLAPVPVFQTVALNLSTSLRGMPGIFAGFRGNLSLESEVTPTF